jgi:hypothetical protein
MAFRFGDVSAAKYVFIRSFADEERADGLARKYQPMPVRRIPQDRVPANREKAGGAEPAK